MVAGYSCQTSPSRAFFLGKAPLAGPSGAAQGWDLPAHLPGKEEGKSEVNCVSLILWVGDLAPPSYSNTGHCTGMLSFMPRVSDTLQYKSMAP